ncbi:MAG: DUF2141 domain-containing protein [Bdellovibrionota bacterium]
MFRRIFKEGLKGTLQVTLFFLFLFQAEACPLCASLELRVKGIQNNRGVIRVFLTRNAASFEEVNPEKIDASQVYFKNLPAKKEDIVFRFNEVPSGDYAYKVFHDENTNEILDTTLIGKPTEALSVSGYSKLKNEPLSFERAKFQLKPRAKMKVLVELGRIK